MALRGEQTIRGRGNTWADWRWEFLTAGCFYRDLRKGKRGGEVWRWGWDFSKHQIAGNLWKYHLQILKIPFQKSPCQSDMKMIPIAKSVTCGERWVTAVEKGRALWWQRNAGLLGMSVPLLQGRYGWVWGSPGISLLLETSLLGGSLFWFCFTLTFY